MRSGQQNKRGRGRNSGGGNRKSSNPLTRSYDSTGPDVKVRGTAQHIAEKYAQLARDAQGSGDRVMAENYLQHAEHYNRIIASAQAQLQERHQRDDRNENADRDEASSKEGEQTAAGTAEMVEAPEIAVNGSGPQPVIDGMPAEVSLNEEEKPTAQQAARRRPRRPRRSTATSEATSADEAGVEEKAPPPASSAGPELAEVAE